MTILKALRRMGYEGRRQATKDDGNPNQQQRALPKHFSHSHQAELQNTHNLF
jgi:hypothetical protein